MCWRLIEQMCMEIVYDCLTIDYNLMCASEAVTRNRLFLVFLLRSFSKDVSCETRTHRTVHSFVESKNVQRAIALKDTVFWIHFFSLAFVDIKKLVPMRSYWCKIYDFALETRSAISVRGGKVLAQCP